MNEWHDEKQDQRASHMASQTKKVTRVISPIGADIQRREGTKWFRTCRCMFPSPGVHLGPVSRALKDKTTSDF